MPLARTTSGPPTEKERREWLKSEYNFTTQHSVRSILASAPWRSRLCYGAARVSKRSLVTTRTRIDLSFALGNTKPKGSLAATALAEIDGEVKRRLKTACDWDA